MLPLVWKQTNESESHLSHATSTCTLLYLYMFSMRWYSQEQKSQNQLLNFLFHVGYQEVLIMVRRGLNWGEIHLKVCHKRDHKIVCLYHKGTKTNIWRFAISIHQNTLLVLVAFLFCLSFFYLSQVNNSTNEQWQPKTC